MSWLRRRPRWSVMIAAGSAFAILSGPAAATPLPTCERALPGELYVSHQANARDADPDTDPEAGTCGHPFRTIAYGLSELGPGGTLNLRGGVYGAVVVRKLKSTEEQQITIRSYPGELATIDASLPLFRTLAPGRWKPATAAGAHPDEFVSKPQQSKVNRGAFVGPGRYTRLITYSDVRDLRAGNEQFRRASGASGRRLRPMYMGPGVWFGGHRIHIRLSHTTKWLPELKAYRGPVDPRQARLALSAEGTIALTVVNSDYVRFSHLNLRGGDDETLRLQGMTGVRFDHVAIFATRRGVRMNKATDTEFAGCRFLGGVPEWFFRSDAKFGSVHADDAGPGAQTSEVLLEGAGNDTGTVIHHSEFRDGHDVYLSGSNLDFHHNWIDNLQDEALLLDAAPSANVKVHENVITRSLTAISFAGAHRGGARSIDRNLIDLRRPISGIRPRPDRPPRDGLRFGFLYKSNPPVGPWDLFQNTFVVTAPQTKLKASFTHLRAVPGASGHGAFNNVFVAVRRKGTKQKAILVVPDKAPPPRTVSDGNGYFRIGGGGVPMFVSLPSGVFRADLLGMSTITRIPQV